MLGFATSVLFALITGFNTFAFLVEGEAYSLGFAVTTGLGSIVFALMGVAKEIRALRSS